MVQSDGLPHVFHSDGKSSGLADLGASGVMGPSGIASLAETAEELVVPLLAEELAIGRRLVETAVVRVARTTVTTDKTVDEELWRTNVVVERVPIGRTVDVVPALREEGDTTVIPVVEEVVVVTRRLVLKEEIRVRRVRESSQHVQTVALRHQQATVERRQAAPSQGSADMSNTPI